MVITGGARILLWGGQLNGRNTPFRVPTGPANACWFLVQMPEAKKALPSFNILNVLHFIIVHGRYNFYTSTDAESLNHVLFLPALNCDCDNMKNCDGNNTLK